MNNHIVLAFFMFARPRLTLTFSAVGLAILLSACASKDLLSRPANWITPYRPDVVQGNFISSEQIAQLRPGLNRLQVRNLLGTPLVSSVFHADRWDYVFTFKRRGGDARVYRYAVFFQGDDLVRFEGDTMPTEAEFIAQLDGRRQLGKVPQLQATPAQLDAAQAKVPRLPPEPPPPPTSAPRMAYPPLEGARP
jgi:outer membrane protein assembly factor BamE